MKSKHLACVVIGSACALGVCVGHDVPSDYTYGATPAVAVGSTAVTAPSVDLKPILLRRIGGCESSGSPTGPLRNIKNHYGSSASGPWQILRTTWIAWQRRYRPDLHFARAMDAPIAIQQEVAMDALTEFGPRPWYSSRRCWKR